MRVQSCVGEAVALVVADTLGAATDAAARVLAGAEAPGVIPVHWRSACQRSPRDGDGADSSAIGKLMPRPTTMMFLAGASTPVLFTSAVLNFGIDQLLSVLLEHAPSPSARPDSAGAEPSTTGASATHVVPGRRATGRFEESVYWVMAAALGLAH